MTTLDRYVLREIAVPLFVGLGLFFVVVAFSQVLQVADAVTGLGIGVGDMGRALIFSLPPLFGLLPPVSTLFAVLLAIGRLSADREVRGLGASGIAPYRLLRVPALTGVVLGGIACIASIWGEPWGVRGLRDLMARSAQRSLAAGVEPGVFSEWLPGIMFSADGRRSGSLADVLFADLRDPQRPVVIAARSGTVRPGAEAGDIVLDMHDGHVVFQTEKGDGRVIRFTDSAYRLDVDRLVGNKGKTLSPVQELSQAELLERSRAPDVSANRRAQYLVAFNRRLAVPLATLIFALLAVPIACQRTGNARARGFLYSAAIVGGYYYVGRALELAARHGDANPVLAAWAPNLVGTAAAVILLIRFARSAA